MQTEPFGRDLNLHVLTRKLYHSGLSGLLKPYASALTGPLLAGAPAKRLEQLRQLLSGGGF